MEQLIMRWERARHTGTVRDNVRKILDSIPAEITLRTFDGSAEDIDSWLEIVSHGLTAAKETPAFFHACINEHGRMEPDKLFFAELNGKPAGTFAVICDHVNKEGYIHMVACRPDARGRGIGNIMSAKAVDTLLSSGMETAYLTTDDFRFAAIRTYLKAGFRPDLSTEDFRKRWQAVFEKIS